MGFRRSLESLESGVWSLERTPGQRSWPLKAEMRHGCSKMKGSGELERESRKAGSHVRAEWRALLLP
jgi:hypothetical protein